MKLTVVMLDTWQTQIAIQYENEHRPYGKRTVQIELSPEQIRQLDPRKLGTSGGHDVHETIGEVWLED